MGTSSRITDGGANPELLARVVERIRREVESERASLEALGISRAFPHLESDLPGAASSMPPPSSDSADELSAALAALNAKGYEERSAAAERVRTALAAGRRVVTFGESTKIVTLAELRRVARGEPATMPHGRYEAGPSASECLDYIATRVVVDWHSQQVRGDSALAADLTAALPVVAMVGARCQGIPLAAWLHRHIRSDQSENIRRLAAQALSAAALTTPDPVGALSTALAGLRDSRPNRVVQAICSGVVARLEPRLPREERYAELRSLLIAGLVQCLTSSRDETGDAGYLPGMLLDPPASPRQIPALVEELRENNPEACARAAAAAALGRLAAAATNPAVGRALVEAAADRAWLVGACAAEALDRLDLSPLLADRILPQLASRGTDQRLTGLWLAGRCGGAASERVLALVLDAYRDPDLRVQAAAAAALHGLAASLAAHPRLLEQAGRDCARLSPLARGLFALTLRSVHRGDASDVGTQVLEWVSPGTVRPSRVSLARRTTGGPAEHMILRWKQAHVVAIQVEVRDTSPDRHALWQETRLQAIGQVAAVLGRGQMLEAGEPLGGYVEDQAGATALFYADHEAAVNHAWRIQSAMGAAGIRLYKIGVASGEVRLERSETAEWELRGPAVDRARRISRIGEAGAVLLDQSTASLLGEWRPTGTALTSLGRRAVTPLEAIPLHRLARAGVAPAAVPQPLRAEDVFPELAPVRRAAAPYSGSDDDALATAQSVIAATSVPADSRAERKWERVRLYLVPAVLLSLLAVLVMVYRSTLLGLPGTATGKAPKRPVAAAGGGGSSGRVHRPEVTTGLAPPSPESVIPPGPEDLEPSPIPVATEPVVMVSWRGAPAREISEGELPDTSDAGWDQTVPPSAGDDPIEISVTASVPAAGTVSLEVLGENGRLDEALAPQPYRSGRENHWRLVATTRWLRVRVLIGRTSGGELAGEWHSYVPAQEPENP